MSYKTKTCPSHLEPAPIPMTGISKSLVTLSATSEGIHSRTKQDAPASCKEMASFSNYLAVLSVAAWTPNPPILCID